MKTDPPLAPRGPMPGGVPARKVFDVMRPGKAPASATSRPVVIGHKAGAQDAQLAVSGIGESSTLMDSKKKIAVQPSSDSDAVPALAQSSAEPNATVQQGQPDAIGSSPAPRPAERDMPDAQMPLVHQSAPQPGPTPAPHQEAEPPKPGAPALAESPTADLPTIPDDKLDEAAAEPEPPEPPAAPAPAPVPSMPEPPTADPLLHDSAAPLLLDDGPSVVVSHHAVTSVWKVLLAILAIILLAAILADILLDTGMLTTTSLPHTHFFK